MNITIQVTPELFTAIVDAVAAKIEGPAPRRPYTVKQAAKLTGIHYDTVYRNVEAGTIRKVPDIGRKILIPASEIDRLLGDGKPKP